MGSLTDFRRQREKAKLTGMDDIPVHFVRLYAEENDRVTAVCPGRIESCAKHAELAYDLFHSGFDVFIVDHRDRRCSGRMLSDPHRGHVDNLNDYVGDLTTFWQQEVLPGPWRKRYILAHLIGGVIATLFLQRRPNQCDTIAPCAPMFSIVMRFPDRIVRHIPDWTEEHPRIREGYTMGTGRWRALSFDVNALTHSRQRYRRNLRFHADELRLCVGGPTHHWAREGALVGEQVLAGAGDDATPTLLIQTKEKRVVNNRIHDHFRELRAAVDHPVGGGQLLVIKGMYHEVFFEKDAMHSVALNVIVELFDKHNSPSGTHFA